MNSFLPQTNSNNPIQSVQMPAQSLPSHAMTHPLLRSNISNLSPVNSQSFSDLLNFSTLTNKVEPSSVMRQKNKEPKLQSTKPDIDQKTAGSALFQSTRPQTKADPEKGTQMRTIEKASQRPSKDDQNDQNTKKLSSADRSDPRPKNRKENYTDKPEKTGSEADNQIPKDRTADNASQVEQRSTLQEDEKAIETQDQGNINRHILRDNNHELLAFLGGQIQKIPAEDLPTLVANNELVTEAISSESVQQYMQTPQPIAQIVSKLELNAIESRNILKQLESNNINMVSPQELLKQLGLDPTRAVIELELLQNNLRLDGLSAYMERAQKPNKNTSNAAEGPKIDQQSRESLPLTDNESSIPLEIEVTEDKVQSPENINLNENQLNVKTDTQNANPDSTQKKTIDGIELTNRDPFSHFDQDLNVMDKKVISINDLANIQTGLEVESDQTTKMSNAITEKLMPNTSLTVNSETTDITMHDDTILKGASEYNQNTNDRANILGLGSLNPSIGKSKATTNDNITLTNEGGTVDLSASIKSVATKENRGQDANGEQGQNSQSETSIDIAPQNVSKSKGVEQSKQNIKFSLTNNNQSPERLSLDPIINQAKMLVNEGGGSIRINLNNADYGDIDLAIQVNENTLELKIATTTEQAREALNAELPKLKDALNQQNLDIKAVEISLKGETSQQWTGFNSQDGHTEGYQHQQSENTYFQNDKQKTERKVSYERQVIKTSNNPSRHNGQISVRV